MKNKKRNKKKLYISLVIIVIILGVASGAYYMKLKNPQDLFVPVTEEEEEINIGDQFDRDMVNILLVGFDKNKSRSKDGNIFRSDTNIVLTINLKEKTVDMISIPRDSYVEIANVGGKDKFNSAYGYGYRYGSSGDHEQDGFEYLMDTASDLLGDIPIYYYAAVDMDVVTEIVDAIGGVEMDVPQDLYKSHGKDRSGIVIHEGEQTLDGYGLLYYARYRHYPKGDIQRVENQQKILLATFDSLKKSNMFSSLPKIYESVQKNIKTNLNINQIAALALLASDMDKTNINTYMVSGDFGNLSDLSYWIVDQQKRVELIQEVYGITVQPEKQDPTQENITSLEVAISQDILEMGQTAEVSAEGSTNLGNHRLFDPGDLNYSSSNNNIVTVSDTGKVTAVGSGNATITVGVEEVSRSINVTVKQPKDTTPPTISLKGEATITLNVGDTFKDPGATAKDNRDGDLSNRIVKEGTVDTTKAGSYKITYKVTDQAGNTASKVRSVVVSKVQPPVEEPKEPEKPVEEEGNQQQEETQEGSNSSEDQTDVEEDPKDSKEEDLNLEEAPTETKNTTEKNKTEQKK